ncbi:hypothetical protein DFS34DRAFT_651382 [Phlyctochytrium arcticum]|nr:hypothetical protein DFS34DRAFT_651382 [Phlyctochytrium arcticum]
MPPKKPKLPAAIEALDQALRKPVGGKGRGVSKAAVKGALSKLRGAIKEIVRNETPPAELRIVAARILEWIPIIREDYDTSHHENIYGLLCDALKGSDGCIEIVVQTAIALLETECADKNEIGQMLLQDLVDQALKTTMRISVRRQIFELINILLTKNSANKELLGSCLTDAKLKKFADFLRVVGEFDCQSQIAEFLYRVFPKNIPEREALASRLGLTRGFSQLKGVAFAQNMRLFLNELNAGNDGIRRAPRSLLASSMYSPEDETFWIDFNAESITVAVALDVKREEILLLDLAFPKVQLWETERSSASVTFRIKLTDPMVINTSESQNGKHTKICRLEFIIAARDGVVEMDMLLSKIMRHHQLPERKHKSSVPASKARPFQSESSGLGFESLFSSEGDGVGPPASPLGADASTSDLEGQADVVTSPAQSMQGQHGSNVDIGLEVVIEDVDEDVAEKRDQVDIVSIDNAKADGKVDDVTNDLASDENLPRAPKNHKAKDLPDVVAEESENLYSMKDSLIPPQPNKSVDKGLTKTPRTNPRPKRERKRPNEREVSPDPSTPKPQKSKALKRPHEREMSPDPLTPKIREKKQKTYENLLKTPESNQPKKELFAAQINSSSNEAEGQRGKAHSTPVVNDTPIVSHTRKPLEAVGSSTDDPPAPDWQRPLPTGSPSAAPFVFHSSTPRPRFDPNLPRTPWSKARLQRLLETPQLKTSELSKSISARNTGNEPVMENLSELRMIFLEMAKVCERRLSEKQEVLRERISSGLRQITDENDFINQYYASHQKLVQAHISHASRTDADLRVSLGKIISGIENAKTEKTGHAALEGLKNLVL